MENIINFKKDIKFDTMIYEITEINIDLDYEVKDYTIDGKYIVDGYYKDSEIKIGSEAFKYTVPFSIELDNNVDLDTVSLVIDDFDYRITNNVLTININNQIKYEEIKNENITEDIFDIRNDFIEDEVIPEPEPEPVTTQSNDESNAYVKYMVHVVKETETLESIAALYHVSSNTILNYNNDTIQPGTKLIIPNEE